MQTNPAFAANLLRQERKRGAIMAVGNFLSGQRVPASGIYEVHHSKHCVPQEVTLLKNERFPPCGQCGTAVQFKIVRVIDGLDKMSEKIILNVLPIMHGEDDEEKAA